MPLIELGSTTFRMVCQRVAPRFQHASRKARGTAFNDSRVEVIMTGMVMIASVSDAEMIEKPK